MSRRVVMVVRPSAGLVPLACSSSSSSWWGAPRPALASTAEACATLPLGSVLLTGHLSRDLPRLHDPHEPHHPHILPVQWLLQPLGSRSRPAVGHTHPSPPPTPTGTFTTATTSTTTTTATATSTTRPSNSSGGSRSRRRRTAGGMGAAGTASVGRGRAEAFARRNGFFIIKYGTWCGLALAYYAYHRPLSRQTTRAEQTHTSPP